MNVPAPLLLAGALLVGCATPPSPPDAAQAAAVAAAAAWKPDDPRTPLFELGAALQREAANPSARARWEAALLRALASPGLDAGARQVLCRELSSIGAAASVSALAGWLADPARQEDARLALEPIPGAAADDAFLKALAAAPPAARVGLVQGLGRRGVRAAAPSLVALLGDADRVVAGAAAAALGEIGGSEAIAALLQVAEGREAARAAEAGKALVVAAGRLAAAGQTADARALFTRLDRPGLPAGVRGAAFAGRVRLAGPDAGALLVGALQADDPLQRMLAAELARGVRDEAALGAVAAALPKLAPDTQVQVLAALEDGAPPVVTPAVRAVARSGDAAVRAAAWRVLGRIGAAEDVPALIAAAANGDEAARRGLASLADPAIDGALARRLGDAPEAEKIEIVRALGERRATTGTDVLLRALADGSPAVRAEAGRALARVAPPAALPRIVETAAALPNEGERQAAVTLLEHVAKKEANPARRSAPLAAALRAASPEARVMAVSALGRLGDDAALAPVRAALKDANAAVTEAAAEALAGWPTSAAVPDLKALVQAPPSPRLGALARRGLIRLTRASPDLTVARKLELYDLALAAGDESDRRAALAAAADLADPAALAWAAAQLDRKAVKAEAELAALQIAEKLGRGGASASAPILRRIRDGGSSEAARRKAAERMDALGIR